MAHPKLDPINVHCVECGEKYSTHDRKKLYCTDACAKLQKARIKDRRRFCRWCGKMYLAIPPNNNQRSCSEKCSGEFNDFMEARWRKAYPDRVEVHRQKRKDGHPDMWREKARQERLETLRILGGKCIVCGVDNPNWLHIDYAPGSDEFEGKRHPRHIAFIIRNKDKFRLLCANHHYELTLTGKIEGTDITQVKKPKKWTRRLDPVKDSE